MVTHQPGLNVVLMTKRHESALLDGRKLLTYSYQPEKSEIRNTPIIWSPQVIAQMEIALIFISMRIVSKHIRNSHGIYRDISFPTQTISSK